MIITNDDTVIIPCGTSLRNVDVVNNIVLFN